MWPNPRDPLEPQWLPDDTEAVLQWKREQALICRGCGHPIDESMDIEAEFAYRPRYLTCHACSTIQRGERSFIQGGGDAAGLRVVAERRESLNGSPSTH